jgi:hypothetical protein
VRSFNPLTDALCSVRFSLTLFRTKLHYACFTDWPKGGISPEESFEASFLSIAAYQLAGPVVVPSIAKFVAREVGRQERL